MNVKLYTVNTEYPDCRPVPAATGRSEIFDSSAEKGKPAGDYDRITIRATQEQAVSSLPAEDRILSLRQQVASGTYRPDARQIASCMLEQRLRYAD